MYIAVDTNILLNHLPSVVSTYAGRAATLSLSMVTIGEMYPSTEDKSYTTGAEEKFERQMETLLASFGPKNVVVSPPWHQQIRSEKFGPKNIELTEKILGGYRDREQMHTIVEWERSAKRAFEQLEVDLPQQWAELTKEAQVTEEQRAEFAFKLVDSLLDEQRDWTVTKDHADVVFVAADKLIPFGARYNPKPLALASFLFESVGLGQMLKHVDEFQAAASPSKDQRRNEWLSAFKAGDPVGFADAVLAVDSFYCNRFLTNDTRFLKGLAMAKQRGLLNFEVSRFG